MLTRIENTYLAILRIVVLVAATIALLVAIGALATSLPSIGRQLGWTKALTPVGGTLGEYIRAKRETVPASPTEPGEQTAVEAPRTANVDIQAAAKTFQSYTRGAGSMTIQKWEQEIEATGGNVPAELSAAYFTDLGALAHQLRESKGKKLTLEQVRELIEWNKSTFLSDADTKAAESQSGAAASSSRLYVAGYAFVLFILVVFTFLFVKVERSLRIVRTVREDNAHA